MKDSNVIEIEKVFSNNLKKKWLVNGRSVRGAMHIKTGTPNQDAIKWTYSKNSNAIILAIADGHGSSIHFRSKIGSKLAVISAIDTLDKFFKNQTIESYNVSQFKDLIRYSLPRLLVHNWIDRVNEYNKKFPFIQNELQSLLRKEDPELINKIISNPKIAYGSTLLAALVTEKYSVFFQIGDGNILIINDSGKTSCPMETANDADLEIDPITSLNQTTSLSMNNSWLEFKTGIYTNYDLKPRLILLSTDGYSNSFNNNENFLKIGVDYLKIFQDKGYSFVVNNLANILMETSTKGSGDDITLGFLYRIN